MKYIAKYLLHDDEFIIRKLVASAKREGAARVEYEDCEEDGLFSNDLTGRGIVKLVDGMCDDFWLWFYDKDGKRLGGFAIVLGNRDYTTVADYIDNEWCNGVWNGLQAAVRVDPIAGKYW